MYKYLLYEKEAPLATITINRPDSMNALSNALTDELGQVFTEVENDKEVRVLIITGAGDRAFMAGADITELQARDFVLGREQIRKIVFTGSARKFAGNPEYFLKLLKFIEHAEFHIYGFVDNYVEEAIKRSGLLNTKVILHGMIPHEQVGRVQRDADFLINFGCENPYMIPCKIFEYVSACKPIIGFYRIQNDSSNPYLENYPNRILIFEDESRIDQNREALDQFLKTEEFPLYEMKDIIRAYWNNTARPMAELIKGEK